MLRGLAPRCRLSALAVFGIALTVPGGRCPAQAPTTEATRIRALLVIDYSAYPPLPGMEFNYSNMRNLFDWLYSQSGNQVTVSMTTIGMPPPSGWAPPPAPADVLNYFRGLTDVGPNDVLLCYYAGHGVTDATRGHVLALRGGELTRRELRQVMESKQARASILLTDCCSYMVPLTPAPRGAFAAAPFAGRPQDELARLLHDLFLRHTGTVDVTAATFDPARRLNEFAWYTRTEGGIFTDSLFQLIAFGRSYADLDANRDNFVSWDEVSRALDERMNTRYSQLKQDYLALGSGTDPTTVGYLQGQARQTPQAFSLGTPAINLAGAVSIQPGAAQPAPAAATLAAPMPVVAGAGPQPAFGPNRGQFGGLPPGRMAAQPVSAQFFSQGAPPLRQPGRGQVIVQGVPMWPPVPQGQPVRVPIFGQPGQMQVPVQRPQPAG